jgi:hypothetical protein
VTSLEFAPLHAPSISAAAKAIHPPRMSAPPSSFTLLAWSGLSNLPG